MSFKSSFPSPAVAAISFCLIGGTIPAPAYADLGDQLFKLLPKDGAPGDEFFRVAISGTTAIVGAWNDNNQNGVSAGSAYLFDTTTGLQLFKLLPDEGASYDELGNSVAISGSTAIVGAYLHDDNGEYSGAAYLFDTTTGRQLFKLLADDGAANDHFGLKVGISGSIAIVGARRHDDNGSGAAYLFDTTTGRQLFKLLPNDGAPSNFFGLSVAISGNIAIVGAGNLYFADSAYLFDTTTGLQLFKLLENTDDSDFGRHVGISGSIAIVGATWEDTKNGSETGAAYLFDTTTGRQLFKLLADDGSFMDRFGKVAISGNIAIVGAGGHDDNGANSGAAYLFDATTGRQLVKLLPKDGAAQDGFGSSVAISGATAIAGAYRHQDNGLLSGAAYLFEASSCPWDLDNNGSVGATDLIALLASWGPCADCNNCPADVAPDCAVGAIDLLALLVNWGPCP